jgi:galactokinase
MHGVTVLAPRRVETSAPGRLCLFGEHQDFLGLPVIALAMTREITFTGTRRPDCLFRIHLPDVDDRDEFDAREELPYRSKRDYLRSAVNVLRRAGLTMHTGYEVRVSGNIPINAGCGSSSSMLIAWIGFLIASQDRSFASDAATIARLAHRAEVLEFEEPGGMMDHYTSALGGLLHIKTEGEIECTPLPAELTGFVLGDSLTPKDTTSTLARSRQAMAEAVEIARQEIPQFSIHTTSLHEARQAFHRLEERGREMLEGNLVNRDICRQGLKLLHSAQPDVEQLGRLLFDHHEQLSRNIRVSTEKIDRMVEAAREAGALGAKINGSGGGGCMFAFAPGREQAVAEAIRSAGGEAHIVCAHPGLRVTAQ